MLSRKHKCNTPVLSPSPITTVSVGISGVPRFLAAHRDVAVEEPTFDYKINQKKEKMGKGGDFYYERTNQKKGNFMRSSKESTMNFGQVLRSIIWSALNLLSSFALPLAIG